MWHSVAFCRGPTVPLSVALYTQQYPDITTLIKIAACQHTLYIIHMRISLTSKRRSRTAASLFVQY